MTGGATRAIGQLAGIQYLRGIAALMVLIYHVPVQLVRMGYDGPWLPGLSNGVDIFYVISGAIMWMTTVGRGGDTPLAFWRRRIVRIGPLYWAVTGFVTLTMLILPHLLQSSRFDGSHVVASLLFTAHVHPVTQMVEPVVIPGWTLNHEMFFYLIFGLFLLVPMRLRCLGVVAILCALVSAGWLFRFAPGSVAGFYTSGMLLEFALGILLGALASRGAGLVRLPVIAGWIMLAAGMIIMFTPSAMLDVPRLLSGGASAGLLVAGLLVIEAHHGLIHVPLLHRAGDASYSIYLSHMVTLSACSQLWRLFELPADRVSLLLFSGLAILTSAGAGWMLYVMVERPLSRWLHREEPNVSRLMTA